MASVAGDVPGPIGGDPSGRTSASPEPGAEVSGIARPAQVSRSRRAALTWPISVTAMVVVIAVGVVHLVASSGTSLVFGGDQAVLALQVHQAAHFHATLGPYSRFGWSHLGPALFYLFAPAYSVSDASPWALVVDSLLLNGAALCLTVAVVRRFAGEWAARWALLPVGLAVAALGALSLETLWNPDLEGAAVLLLAVLAAGAFTGSGPSMVGMALAGTYLVQTDIGTVPAVGVMTVTASTAYVIRTVARRLDARRPTGAHSPGSHVPVSTAPVATEPAPPTERPRWRAWVLGGTGAALVVAAWIPPAVQQAGGRPGNITRLLHFFSSPQSGPGTAGTNHSLAQAWHVVANTVSVTPFGPVPSSDTFTAASTGRQAVLVVSLAVSVVAIGLALWRRNAFALGLGTMSLVGLVSAVVAAMRIVGPVYSYLMLWAVFLPVPAWIALGIVAGRLSDTGVRRRLVAPAWRVGTVLGLSVALAVPVALFARQLATVPWSSTAADRQIPSIAAFAIHQMRADSTRTVEMVIDNGDRWPVVSGVMLALTDRGYHPVVQPAWEFMFTSRALAGPGTHAELVFTDPAPASAPQPAAPPVLTFTGPWGPTAVRYVPPTAG